MSKLYDRLYSHFRRYLKNLLRNYFIWEGLPDTIDARKLEEMLLFEGGIAVGFKWTESYDKTYKDKIIVSAGALPGIDLYARPTSFTSANPYIVPDVKRIPYVDCVPCYNTRNYQIGETCVPVVDIYADLLAHETISMRTSVMNSRVTLIPTVKDDKEALRINKLIREILDGECFALRYKMSEFDGTTLFPVKAKDNIVVSELADARRCIMADFFAETGVKTVAVDKRERTNIMEMESNTDQTKIACDIMLSPRKLWAEQMNGIFGTDISVKFNQEVVKNEFASMEDANDDTSVDA